MVESERVLAKEEVVEVAVVVVRTEGALIAQEVGEDSIVFAVIDLLAGARLYEGCCSPPFAFLSRSTQGRLLTPSVPRLRTAHSS